MTAEASICRIDADLRVGFVNPYAVRMLAYRNVDEMLGLPVVKLVALSDHRTLERELGKRSRGEPGCYRILARRKDRSLVPVLVSSTPVYEDGIYCGSFGISRELSPSMAGRRDRALSRAMSQIAETLPFPFFVVAADLRIRGLNARARQLLVDEGERGPVRSASLRPFLGEEARSRLGRALAELAEGERTEPFLLDFELPGRGRESALCLASRLELGEDRPAFGLGLTELLSPRPDRAAARDRAYAEYRLSGRERQIAGLLADGAAYKEIAAQLEISLSTVRTFGQRLYRKMRIHARSELRSLLSNDGSYM